MVSTERLYGLVRLPRIQQFSKVGLELETISKAPGMTEPWMVKPITWAEVDSPLWK